MAELAELMTRTQPQALHSHFPAVPFARSSARTKYLAWILAAFVCPMAANGGGAGWGGGGMCGGSYFFSAVSCNPDERVRAELRVLVPDGPVLAHLPHALRERCRAAGHAHLSELL
jgi:hypothetical protein